MIIKFVQFLNRSFLLDSDPSGRLLPFWKLALVLLTAATVCVNLAAQSSALAQSDVVTPASQVQLLYAPQVELPITIELKPEAIVGENRIYLGEVARCFGADAICEESSAVDLASAPEPGSQISLSAEKISAVLNLEFPDAHIAMTGARSVQIRSEFRVIDEAVLERMLADALEIHNQKYQKQIKVELLNLRLMKSIKVLPRDYVLLIPELEESFVEWARKASRSWTPIQGILRGDGAAFQVRFQAQFAVFGYLPLAKETLDKGHIVKKSDIELGWLRVRGVAQNAYETKLASIIGKELTVKVQSKSGIPERYLRAPKVIRRGEVVSIETKRGGLTIRSRGKALGGGGVGQIIELEHLATRKRVRGVIAGNDLVRLKM